MKGVIFTNSPSHTSTLGWDSNTGVDLIVTVNTIGGEALQLGLFVFTACTVIVPIISAPVLFTGAIQFAILSVPLAAKPILVLLFVQLTVEPLPIAGATVKFPILIAAPAHTLIFEF